MKRVLLTVFTLLLIAGTAHAEYARVEWAKTWQVNGTAWPIYNIVVDADGNTYTSGDTSKYDTNGNRIWENPYYHYSYFLNLLPDGGLAFRYFDGTDGIGELVKLDSATGATLFEVAPRGLDGHFPFAVDGSGNIAYTGSVYAGVIAADGSSIWSRGKNYFDGFQPGFDTTGNNYFLINKVGYGIWAEKRDPVGNLLWQKRVTPYQMTELTDFNGSIFDTDGNLYIAYSKVNYNKVDQNFVCFKKISNVDGSIVWRLEISPLFAREGHQILKLDKNRNLYAVDTAGALVLGGEGGWLNVIRRIDKDGRSIWKRRYTSSSIPGGNIHVSDAVVDDDGALYIVGSVWKIGYKARGLIVKYNPSGTVAWSREITKVNGAAVPKVFYSIGLDAAKNVYVGGYAGSWRFNSRSYYLLMKFHQTP